MLSLGIDFGTSGARAIAINPDGEIQAQVNRRFAAVGAEELAAVWQTVLFDLLAELPLEVRRQLGAIAINGTSSTVLLCDDRGIPLTAPLLYNDDRGASVVTELRAIAPPHHTVLSATSSLAKLLWWTHSPLLPRSPAAAPYFLHQADWLAFLLHGCLGITDYHNALKLGYDVENLCYPEWLLKLDLPFQLPQVIVPGTAIAPVLLEMGDRFQLPSACQVCAGTTDSIAAFLASGVQQVGEAVTSLGSTLVLKLLSQQRVEDARYGIYSHRLGDLWLVGGASNAGGAVLRRFFRDEELVQLSQQIDPDQDSGLDYYPLNQPGDRFPINDPTLLPRLEPRPDDPVRFLHGLLEGIARIEAEGYRRLLELGASPVTRVYTAGGGARNRVWLRMRSRYLGVPVERSEQTEAAYGTALLAMRGF